MQPVPRRMVLGLPQSMHTSRMRALWKHILCLTRVLRPGMERVASAAAASTATSGSTRWSSNAWYGSAAVSAPDDAMSACCRGFQCWWRQHAASWQGCMGEAWLQRTKGLACSACPTYIQQDRSQLSGHTPGGQATISPGKMLYCGPMEKYFLRAAVMGELISLAAPAPRMTW